MRSCGQGYASLEKFNFSMNLPKPMKRKNYNTLSSLVKDACKETAFETMKETADLLNAGSEYTDVSISADGSWQ